MVSLLEELKGFQLLDGASYQPPEQCPIFTSPLPLSLPLSDNANRAVTFLIRFKFPSFKHILRIDEATVDLLFTSLLNEEYPECSIQVTPVQATPSQRPFIALLIQIITQQLSENNDSSSSSSSCVFSIDSEPSLKDFSQIFAQFPFPRSHIRSSSPDEIPPEMILQKELTQLPIKPTITITKKTAETNETTHTHTPQDAQGTEKDNSKDNENKNEQETEKETGKTAETEEEQTVQPSADPTHHYEIVRTNEQENNAATPTRMQKTIHDGFPTPTIVADDYVTRMTQEERNLALPATQESFSSQSLLSLSSSSSSNIQPSQTQPPMFTVPEQSQIETENTDANEQTVHNEQRPEETQEDALYRHWRKDIRVNLLLKQLTYLSSLPPFNRPPFLSRFSRYIHSFQNALIEILEKVPS